MQKEQTAINDNQIRATSVTVECLAHNIQSQAILLRDAFNELYPNLQFAAPVKDEAFSRYLVTLAHVVMLCDQAPSLAHQAREMQSYGKQQLVVDVSNLSHLTPAPAPVAVPA